jgi:hypothetical protein
MDCEVRVSEILLTYFSQRHCWDDLHTPAMQKIKHRLLRIYIAWILRPDIELQAILGDRIVILCCKVLPNVEAGRLSEVGKATNWWLVRWTVGRLPRSVVKPYSNSCCKLTHSEASKIASTGATYFLGAANLNSPTGASA